MRSWHYGHKQNLTDIPELRQQAENLERKRAPENVQPQVLQMMPVQPPGLPVH